MGAVTTTLEDRISVLEEKIARIEEKLDYLISLLEEDEDFGPEEVEELKRRIERIEKGEARLYPAEEVFKKLGLNVS